MQGNLYGRTDDRANALRSFSNGKMKTSSFNGSEYPPLLADIQQELPDFTMNAPATIEIDTSAPATSQTSFYATGDPRFNLHLGHLHWSTRFLRLHNSVCDSLLADDSSLSDEQVSLVDESAGHGAVDAASCYSCLATGQDVRHHQQPVSSALVFFYTSAACMMCDLSTKSSFPCTLITLCEMGLEACMIAHSDIVAAAVRCVKAHARTTFSKKRQALLYQLSESAREGNGAGYVGL